MESDERQRNAQYHLKQRRDILKLAGATLVAGLSGSPARSQSRHPKRIVIGGGGIAGLSCGYELKRRGHDVTILEAAGRTGGHVRTLRDPFADELYADVGAEHFTQEGYELLWQYVKEFDLPVLPFHRRDNYIRFIDGRAYSEEMLADRAILKGFGFNRREIEYLVRNKWSQLRLLYFESYLDAFEDEYRPFDASLNHLDQISVASLLQSEGASPAAVRFVGGSSVSALQQAWDLAIRKIRGGIPLSSPRVFRIKGGNQLITDAFTARLGGQVRLGCAVTAIEHGGTGVTVHFRESGGQNKIVADYLVCCMSAWMLRSIPVTPPLPEAKAYAIENMPYYTKGRAMFQSRTRFWEEDGLSPNMDYGEPALEYSWTMAEEVPTSRGLTVGMSEPTVDAQSALEIFRRYYPGKSENIEHAIVHDWSRDPWAAACERIPYRIGELANFWPIVIQPHGRIHFAGAYADNLSRGMEAATRSANRVAKAIDKA